MSRYEWGEAHPAISRLDVDSEEHTPMAMQMLADLCGDNEAKWRDCAETMNRALAARRRLWDGILAAIQRDRPAGGTP